MHQIMDTKKAVFVPELNLGMFVQEVQKFNRKNIPVVGINRVDSYPILPAQICNAIEEVAR